MVRSEVISFLHSHDVGIDHFGHQLVEADRWPPPELICVAFPGCQATSTSAGRMKRSSVTT